MIVVVDYGMGNLRSVSKALEHLGGDVRVSADPADVSRADKLVLPGVGAFGNAMEELRRRKLLDPVREYLTGRKPFLGICLGLQLLLNDSEESPSVDGFGCVGGHVQGFRGSGIKVPHMGWNKVCIRKQHPVLRGVKDGSYFYFVHSFYAVCNDIAAVAASCTHGTDEFAAIVARDSIIATQFHPEKSQEAGLRILKNFLEW
ncbi:MAG: imidazole glycerol phosphate synthase subunit HisH [Candidatus Omnitrophota bacterium]|nr:imidazole glycerol phosphate synthase subunit HisH [Candidatus Omnitrophota bacterium]